MVVVGGRRVGVGDDLLVLELAEELGERAEGQAQLVGDPPARGGADAEQELEDQALDLGGVQARLLEVGHRPGPERVFAGPARAKGRMSKVRGAETLTVGGLRVGSSLGGLSRRP